MFTPVISKVMARAQEAQQNEPEQQQYYVLLILTDGVNCEFVRDEVWGWGRG